MRERIENWVGLLIYGGCAVSLACGFGSWFLLVGLGVSGARFGAESRAMNGLIYLGLFLTFLGVTATAAGIVWGIGTARNELKGSRVRVEKARVVARYAVDRDNMMYTDDFAVAQLEDPRYYLRLDVGDSVNAEYQCPEHVFWQAGEGTVGEAEIQGRWCGMYRPYVGPGQGIQDDRVASL